jgi:hypothetical protein
MADEPFDLTGLARQAQSRLRPKRAHRARERLGKAAGDGDVAALGMLARLGDPPGRWATEMWRYLIPLPPGPEFDRIAEGFTAIGLVPDPSTLTTTMRESVVRAARDLADHPVGRAARAKIVAHADTHPDLIDEVCRVACLPPDPEGLLSFCEEHGLVPNDPVAAARFFSIVDRERYREHDPDGSLLVQAYRSSDTIERWFIGQLPVATKDQDLLRRMLEPELSSLRLEETKAHQQLAFLEDWPTLWRLASHQPTFEMAGLSAMFPPDWAPESDAERHIYSAARALRDDPGPHMTDVVRVGPEWRYRYGISTASGGSQIAMITGKVTANNFVEQSVKVFGGGQDPVASYPYDSIMPAHDQLLHLGDDVTLTGSYRALTLYHDGRVIPLVAEHVDALVATPDGGYAALTQGHLVFGDATGRITENVPLATLGLSEGNTHLRTRYLAVRTDGALAIGTAGEIVVDPTGQSPRRATLPGANISAMAFDGQRVAVAAWGRAGTRERALRYLSPSGELERYVAEDLPGTPEDLLGGVHDVPIRRLDALPGLRSLLFTEGRTLGNVASTVRTVGDAPLDPILTEPLAPWVHVLSVEAGRYLAIGRGVSEHRLHGVELTVHDLHRTMAQDLLFRPASELKRFHPTLLDGLPEDRWLALLRARLERARG